MAGVSVANSAIPWKTYLGGVRGEVGDEFVVDGQIRGQNKKIVQAVGQM